MQRCEVREPDGVDDAVPVEERIRRDLVEYDHDRRRVGPDVCRVSARRAREREARSVRVEQEEREEDERGGGEYGQNRPRGGRARVHRRPGRAHRPRDRDQRPSG